VYVFHNRTGGALSLTLLAVAAVSVVFLQYRGRRTMLARILAVAAAAGVVLLIVLFSGPMTFSMSMAQFPAAGTHLNMTLLPPDPHLHHGPYSRRVYVELPVRVAGIPESHRAFALAISMEISAASGVRYVHNPPRDDFDVGLMETDAGFSRLSVAMSRAAYDRIKDSRVTISGAAGFELYRLGRKVGVSIGESRQVTPRMHCSCTYDEGRYDSAYLSVFCDSPFRQGLLANIRVEEKSRVHLWPQFAGIRTNGSPSPLVAWLSPLERRQESYGVVMLPNQTVSDVLEDPPISIVPQYLAGYATATFQATDIDLREYSK